MWHFGVQAPAVDPRFVIMPGRGGVLYINMYIYINPFFIYEFPVFSYIYIYVYATPAIDLGFWVARNSSGTHISCIPCSSVMNF